MVSGVSWSRIYEVYTFSSENFFNGGVIALQFPSQACGIKNCFNLTKKKLKNPTKTLPLILYLSFWLIYETVMITEPQISKTLNHSAEAFSLFLSNSFLTQI